MLRLQDGGTTLHDAVVGESEGRRLGDADDFLCLPLDAFPLGTAGDFTFASWKSFLWGSFLFSFLGTSDSLP